VSGRDKAVLVLQERDRRVFQRFYLTCSNGVRIGRGGKKRDRCIPPVCSLAAMGGRIYVYGTVKASMTARDYLPIAQRSGGIGHLVR